MRKHLVVLSLALWSAQAAWGTVLINDNFTRSPEGNLVPTSPSPGPGSAWAAHSGLGSTPVLVSSGQITLNQGAGTREDVNIAADGGVTMSAGSRWYAAFDLTVPAVDTSTNPIGDVYFAHFIRNSSTFDGRIWMTAPTNSGFRLALSNDSSITNNNGEVRTSDLAFDTTYRIVTYYDYDAKANKLWIDPVDESSASYTPTDVGTSSNAVYGYAFRQATVSSGTTATSQVIDNLIVGTTFADVVPEPMTMGLLVLGCGLCARSRRRR